MKLLSNNCSSTTVSILVRLADKKEYLYQLLKTSLNKQYQDKNRKFVKL